MSREAPADGLEAPALSMGQMAWRRFRNHRMAVVGTVTIFLLSVYSFGGAIIFSEADASAIDTGGRLQPPVAGHLFGTDTVGRDILARTIYGGQVSLLIGLAVMLLQTIVGVLIGAIAGYYEGIIDSILMRFTEAMVNIPQIFLLIVMAKFFGGKMPDVELFGRTLSGSVIVIILIIGMTSWMYLARIVRAQFLSIKENEFILAARGVGASNWRIIFRHVLPNGIAPIAVSATLGVSHAILNEAYISFLGLGVQPPTATWGNMLDGAHNYIQTAPWLWIFPGFFIILTVLSINFVGDGLRDALDPHNLPS